MKDGIKVLFTIARLFEEYRPAIFFNIFAILFLILSIVLFIPILIHYFNTGLVPRFPTLILSLILLVLSILMWITGIILEVINKKHRQLYELYLNNMEKLKKE